MLTKTPTTKMILPPSFLIFHFAHTVGQIEWGESQELANSVSEQRYSPGSVVQA